MDIFPAIDISQGRVVRLRQGDYDQVTTYRLTPLQAAQDFERKGARFLHVVDLDGAKAGEPINFDAIAQVVANCGLFVEIGGGLRQARHIEQYLQAGAGRVILGTAAVAEPEFLAQMLDRFGPKLAVGVDARRGLVAIRGWQEDTALQSTEFCRQLAGMGLKTVIYTDIATDGMLAGANREIYPLLTAIPGLDIVASGGVSSQEDILSLKQAGCRGAIIGKALYAGKIDLAEAIGWAK